MSSAEILKNEVQTLAIRRTLRDARPVDGVVGGLLTARLLATPLICAVSVVVLAGLLN